MIKKLSLIFSYRLICVSNEVKRIMYPGNNPKVIVVHDWIDRDTFTYSEFYSSLHDELGLPRTIRLVGCIGRLEWWKGQHIFLEAIKIIAPRYSDVHFLIVGGATTNKEDYINKLISQINKSVYSDRISILGHRNDIANIMSQLSVMAHTSIYPEPFGLIIMEAMYCKTIVVAAKAGGVLDQIIDGETGFLYTPGDPEELAKTIMIALEYSDRNKIIKNAKLFVQRKFNKERNFSKIDQLYNELLR